MLWTKRVTKIQQNIHVIGNHRGGLFQIYSWHYSLPHHSFFPGILFNYSLKVILNLHQWSLTPLPLNDMRTPSCFNPEFHPFMVLTTSVSDRDQRYLVCRKQKSFGMKNKTMEKSEKPCSGWERKQGSSPARRVNGCIRCSLDADMQMC